MSRNPDDDNVVHLPPHGRPPATEGRFGCMRCGTLTLVSTLNHYGARCFSCYEAYCRAVQPRPTHMGDKRADPKGWVQAFEKRRAAGEQLTPAQLEMLRAAKRHDGWTGGAA